MEKSTIGVLGIGEVGKAISQIFQENFAVLEKDLTVDMLSSTQVYALHVCLPDSDKFEDLVLKQIKKNRPQLVIIHSTVMPGTSEKIFRKSKVPTVHSPVMGTHPNLKEDIKSFIKIIGPTSAKSASLAKEHFAKAGIKTQIFKSALESEIGKLLDTSYYAWNILFSKLVWDICKDNKINYENVYSKFNQIYNTGYKKTKPNVIRPILKFQPGPIGGHCLIPNAQILGKSTKSPIARIISELNQKL